MSNNILFYKALNFLILVIALIFIQSCSLPVKTTMEQERRQENAVPIQLVTSAKGIDIWLIEDHTIPVISVDFSFAGGMAFETENKMGLSYMLSVMMDEGAGKYDSQSFQKQLEDYVIGMSFTPGRDYFNGHIKTLSKNKTKAFELLKLALTEPHFSAVSLERMQKNTVNRIKTSLADPSWNAARIFNAQMFGNHAYARPGQGNLHTIPNITEADLHELAKKIFTRQGLKISVAGDINPQELVKFIDDSFGTLPKKNHLKDLDNSSAYNESNTGKTVFYKMDIPQSIILFAQQGYPLHGEDYPAVMVLNYILGGGGFSSRLMQSLREDNGLTYGVYTNLSHLKYVDLLQGQFSTKNKTVVEAINMVKEQWQKISDEGVSQQEVDDAISYLTGSLPLALTSTNKISGVLNSLQKNGRDINYINQRNELLQAVTLDDVKRVAKELLKTENLSFVIVGQPENLKNAEVITKLPKM